MNNLSHDELTRIIQAELTELDTVLQPSLKSFARKLRYIGIMYLVMGIILGVLLAQDIQSLFFIMLPDVIYIIINGLITAILVISGLIFLLFGSQKAVIKHSTKKIVRKIENHINTPFTFSVDAQDRIVLKLKHRKLYFKPNELHITSTQIEHFNLIWAPSYFKRSMNRLRAPLIIYCDDARLEQFKRVFSSAAATKVPDD